MLIYYLVHFWKFKELKVILDYRKNREQNNKKIVEEQFKIVAKKYNLSEEKVEKLVHEWLFEKPLKVVKTFKDKKLSELIEKFKKSGMNIIIYSDYPTKEKLETLNIIYDKAYDSTHSQICVLKPNPKGLQFIMEENKLEKEEILFVGDRDSKDGECARQCQVDYVILPKFFRKKKYLEIESKIGGNK